MKAYLFAAASGALYALGYERAALWPLELVALVPLLVALELYARSARHALLLGWAGGLVLNGYAYRWLLPTIHAYAGLPLVAAVLIWVVLILYQAGQLALWCGLVVRSRARGWSLALVAPVAWVALEQVYPVLFPAPFAGSLHPVPLLLQSLELAGTAPLSLLLVLLDVAFALLVGAALRRSALGTHVRRLGAVLAVWLALVAYGARRMEQVRAEVARAPAVTVGIVQANLGTKEKRSAHAEVRRRHLEQSRMLEERVHPDLLIWPETAVAGLVPAGSADLSPSTGRLRTPLLTGALAFRAGRDRTLLFNSAFLLDAGGRVLARSDKLRLVPFAERLPLGERFPVLYDLVPGAGEFTPGARPAALQLNGHRIAALICYEDILPDLVREVMSATSPELLVNITNDAWFGDTPAPRFHFALSTLRAIEHRRFLVRATNSGISGVVDPTGTVLRATRTFERASLGAKVAWLSTRTPYSLIGDVAGYAAVLACAVLSLVRRRKHYSRGSIG